MPVGGIRGVGSGKPSILRLKLSIHEDNIRRCPERVGKGVFDYAGRYLCEVKSVEGNKIRGGGNSWETNQATWQRSAPHPDVMLTLGTSAIVKKVERNAFLVSTEAVR